MKISSGHARFKTLTVVRYTEKQTNTMKYLLIFFFSFAFSHIQAQVYPTVKTIHLNSKELDQEREIFIYTPPYYNENIYEKYNVIFVFDSQHKSYFDLAHSALFFSNENDHVNPHIVVGIPALLNEDPDNFYSRNSDFLPKPLHDTQSFFYGQANFDNFFNFIEKELIPYVNDNYRTLPNRVFIGHSLSASFVLKAFITNPDIAKGYLVISPNIRYDKERLVNEVLNLEADNSDKFIYFSHVADDDGFVLSNSGVKKIETKLNTITHFEIDSLPNRTHHTTFLPSLVHGYASYFKFLNKEGYYLPKSIKIRVKVPNADDDVFISGNHKNLGNYQDGKIKLKHISDFIREIEVNIPSPSYIRFTGGSNHTEAIMKSIDLQELFSFPIDILTEDEYEFEIIDWTN